MKVAVGVHGRFHAFDLARELASHGVSVSLTTTYPAAVARRLLPPGVEIRTVPHLELVRRMAPHVKGLPSPDVWIASRFGRAVARTLPQRADVFVGWSGASVEALDVARSRGMRIVIERGSTHIAHQAKILSEENARHGVGGPIVDPRMIERELTEYAAADAIMVPTRFAAQTFIRAGTDPEKLSVNPYGVSLTRFAAIPTERPTGSPIRVLFVGGAGLRKGVPYLLEAMGMGDSDFELHLVGPVEPGIRNTLNAFGSGRIHAHGALRGPALEAQFRDADIFCLPSLEEGLSLALLQAMAAGLPVIATPETGIEDVATDAQEAIVVPSRDPDRIAAALQSLKHRDDRIAMGAAARARVAIGFSWKDYGERALASYVKLLAQPSPSNSLGS